MNTLGSASGPTRKSADFRVRGMDCADEIAALRRSFAAVPGVGGVDFDLLRQRLTVHFDPGVVGEPALLAAVARAGLAAEPWRDDVASAEHGGDNAAALTGAPAGDASGAHAHTHADAHGHGNAVGHGHARARAQGGPDRGAARWSSRDRLTLVAGAALLAGMLWHALSAGSLLSVVTGSALPLPARLLYLFATALAALPLLPRAGLSLRALRPDMHLLMLAAIVGALVLDDTLEAATVAELFAISLLLEAWSVGRARRAVSALIAFTPPHAELLAAGESRRVPVADVGIGARIRVRPGERVPLDGRIVEGRSAIDESPLTGESLPVEKGPGADVFAGTINGSGALAVVTTRTAQDATLARIQRLVASAHSQRGASERFVERFARIYTPLVMALALLVALLPPLFAGALWKASLYDALVLLVIACPCALVISTPVAVVCALASAARAGVLIKGGRFIEEPAHLRTMAFDKTGTLTRGRPQVTAVRSCDRHSERQLLALAAGIETASNHPLAGAIVECARSRGVTALPVSDVHELPGRGAEGLHDGQHVWIGSHRLLEERGQETPEQHATLVALEAQGQSVVIVGSDDHVCGWIVLADEPRPDAAAAIAALHAAGIARVVMLTGDNRGTAEVIARRLGIDEVRHGLLPEDKLAAMTELAARAGPAAMVGDGVNDAPALAASRLGIALGGAASDVAIETADVVVMSDDLLRLPWLVQHSRRTLAVIHQNIGAAVAIKALFLALALAGHSTLWAAIAADMGVSLAVVFNALRLLRPQPLSRAVSGPAAAAA